MRVRECDLAVECERIEDAKIGRVSLFVRCPAAGLTYSAGIGTEATGAKCIRVERHERGEDAASKSQLVFQGSGEAATMEKLAAVVCHRLLRSEAKRLLRLRAEVAATALRIDQSVQAARRDGIQERNNESRFYQRAAEVYVGLAREEAMGGQVVADGSTRSARSRRGKGGPGNG